MRMIRRPDIDSLEVYNLCVNSIHSSDLKERISLIQKEIESSGQDYIKYASSADLYLTNHFSGRNNEVVVGTVTKAELKALYTSHFVSKKKPARKFYDQLRSLAEFGICPFCGFGHVSTLDHYLPKSKFPLDSILPCNLVPCCSDCNSEKKTSIAKRKEEQVLHPYFDHSHFINEQWLYAELTNSGPLVVSFKVDAPTSWNQIDRERVKSHFDEFLLAKRLSVEAAQELSILKGELKKPFQSGAREVHLNLLNKESVFREQHQNSWKTAMYQALADSGSYCDGGFLLK